MTDLIHDMKKYPRAQTVDISGGKQFRTKTQLFAQLCIDVVSKFGS